MNGGESGSVSDPVSWLGKTRGRVRPASETITGTKNYRGSSGLAEIDVRTLRETGSSVVDHGNVTQHVMNHGRPIDLQNATEAAEVMIKNGIDPKAVKIIRD